MKSRSELKERFLKDVSSHELKIIKDDGVYRHIRLGRPGSSFMFFDIVTWPGNLAYTGDMGTYTFSRVPDMFTFFRDSNEDWGINPGYWSEKVQSADRDGIKEFSWDLFEQNVLSYCETDEQKEFMKDELKYVEHDDYGACAFYREFDNDNEAGVDLSDFWESDNEEYTFRFLWCCHALVWAIQQYDNLKNNNSKEAA